MPHLIDFDGLESDLFVLQHAAYGSKEFCEKFDLNTDCYGGDYEWWEYKGMLKIYVSNKIIEAAIKMRMLQDFAIHDNSDVDLKQIVALNNFQLINRNMCQACIQKTKRQLWFPESSVKTITELSNVFI